MENTIFVEQFKHYGNISIEAELDLLSRIRHCHHHKGDKIIREGQITTSFFIIEHGMVRSFYRKGASEITNWFAYDGQKAVSIASLFDNKPSHETVECVEESDLLYISNKDLLELYAKYECLNTIGRKMVEEYCGILEYRAYSLQIMSAEERYKDLMTDEPEIIKRVPLRYIASFLGISQETLSRIRHKW